MAILVMADPDWPVGPEHQEYWTALGRFIHRFAMAEQSIHFLLRLTTKTPPEVSQAIFSGTRAKQALSLIDRTREALGLQPDPDFERAKAQFGIINGVRDDVVHHGAILYREGFLISNAQRTIKRQQFVKPISVADLSAMTEDLQTIAATLFVMQLDANGDDPSRYLTDWREVGRSPWLYKSRRRVADPGTHRGGFLEQIGLGAKRAPRDRAKNPDRPAKKPKEAS